MNIVKKILLATALILLTSPPTYGAFPDYDNDHDVDGSDLAEGAALLADNGTVDVSVLAGQFGSVTQDDAFSFIVFGDLNGGDCQRNVRFHNLVELMVNESASFYVSTGDLIEGYGTTSCFAHDNACTGEVQSGNMQYQLTPLMNQPPAQGLSASFFPVIGNHDAGWGSNWYPDPCGDGICDLLDPSIYINHGDILNVNGFYNHNLNHGDICSKVQGESGYADDFYYSFAFKNSYFIFLNQKQDYSGMLSCNGGHTGYDSCADYCSDPDLYLDSMRNNYCYNVFQYDWLVSELQYADSHYDHIFVFAHAPLLTSSWNHSATHGAGQIRNLLESYNVDIYFNGHNHAYERTRPVKGDQAAENGTTYITTGSAGALTDGINTAWFTAASYLDWTSYNNQDDMTTYLQITVIGADVSGRVVSLGAGEVDVFETGGSPNPPCENPDDYLHVSVDGDDANGNGTFCKPYKTIQKGVDALVPGATLVIHEGEYTPIPAVLINIQGTEALPVVIRGKNAIIDGSGNDHTMGVGSTFFVDHSRWLTIKDLTFINSSYNSIRTSFSHHITIDNIVSERAYMHGIFTDFCDDFLLKNSRITDSLHSHGVYFSNSGDRPIIKNNIFRNNYDAGFQINADPQSDWCVNEGYVWGVDSLCDGITTNALVENNIISGNGAAQINLASVRDSIFRNNLVYRGQSSGIAAWGDGNGPEWGSKNNIFLHNTVYIEPGQGRAPLSLKEGSTGNTVMNNILISGRDTFCNYGGLELDATSLEQNEIDHNIYYRQGTAKVITIEDVMEYTLAEWRTESGFDVHSLMVSPSDLYVDLPGDDFHLSVTSPAIDNGSNAGLLYDLEGQLRPQGAGFDMGAYERE